MSDVFIAHVEEDADVALEIALGLEEAGYSIWCYELDSIPGPSYLLQTGKAVEESRAVVVVISPHSVGSRQVTKEVVRAHESNNEFVPVLRGITHVEFQNRQPEWREAIGAATSISILREGGKTIIPRIINGLQSLGIFPGRSQDALRIARIKAVLDELKGPKEGTETREVTVSVVQPSNGDITVKEPQQIAATVDKKKARWMMPTIIASGILVIIIVAVVFWFSRGITSPAVTVPGINNTSNSIASGGTQVKFTDSNLENAIREAIQKETGPVYVSDMESVTRLQAAGRNISNLSGLEYCKNLEVLNINDNNISDISPLTELTKFRDLSTKSNDISDLSPLKNHINLEQLILANNSISDISPLAGLINLRSLYLVFNNINDIAPLVENKGLSNGDLVILLSNPLSTISATEYIPQLKQRGVNVVWEEIINTSTYEDDFSIIDPGWKEEFTQNYDTNYVDKEYHISVKKPFNACWMLNMMTGQFADFSLEIDARLISGGNDTSYGLIFRTLEPQTFYNFRVSGLGDYYVGKRLNGRWVDLGVWTKSAFINKGYSTNHLKVIFKDDQLELYVNGHYLTTVTDDSIAKGYVGMIVETVESTGNAAFDNIKVYSAD